MDQPKSLKRRAIFAAAGGLGFTPTFAAAAPTPALPADAPESAWPPQITASPIDVCLKMRMSTGPALRAGCLMGRYYGVVDNETTHLFNLLSAAFYLARPRPDGAFDTRYFEIAYFTDPLTGEPLGDWVNPYTGQTGKVPQTRNGPGDSILGKDLSVNPKMSFPGMSLQDRFLPPVVLGNNVWLTERIGATIPAAATHPRIVYNENTVALARLSDVNNPNLTHVPATTNTVITVDWRPWMQMGARPGNMMAIGTGELVDRVSDLPARYLELGEKYHPDVFADPHAFMMKGWA